MSRRESYRTTKEVTVLTKSYQIFSEQRKHAPTTATVPTAALPTLHSSWTRSLTHRPSDGLTVRKQPRISRPAAFAPHIAVFRVHIVGDMTCRLGRALCASPPASIQILSVRALRPSWSWQVDRDKPRDFLFRNLPGRMERNGKMVGVIWKLLLFEIYI